MTLRFDEATHTYTLDGMVVPSVTGVLGPIQPDYSYATTELGSAVHALTEQWDIGIIDLASSVPEDCAAHLRAWRLFRHEHAFVPLHIEERVFNSLHRYAGTVDRIGTWGEGDSVVILDIKTGDPAPWHGVQLAGYVLAAERMGLVARGITRIGVYLAGDGTYRVREYSDASDFPAFLAALTLNNWKASHPH